MEKQEYSVRVKQYFDKQDFDKIKKDEARGNLDTAIRKHVEACIQADASLERFHAALWEETQNEEKFKEGLIAFGIEPKF